MRSNTLIERIRQGERERAHLIKPILASGVLVIAVMAILVVCAYLLML